MKLKNTFIVQEIKSKTSAKFFKDLKVGDVFTLEYTLNGMYGSAPSISILQDGEKVHLNNANQLGKNLSNFKLIDSERKRKVDFIVEAVKEIEGVTVPAEDAEALSDEELDKDVEWYEYLLTK